jgi:transposase
MMAPEPVYFYTAGGAYGDFSNFSRHGVEVEGLWWPTVEHYFQAQKFEDPGYRERIRAAPDPRRAAELGRSRAVPLRLLFRANRRLHTAYLLKESFGQLWDSNRPGWARRFFENWKDALRWQRLEPFRKFAAMVEAHWDGIAAYCREENKVPLGFVEGFNNKVRALQRRAYGYRDEEYFRLKILTCMLPKL